MRLMAISSISLREDMANILELGLTDVERNGADIVTAVLTYTDRSSSELAMMQSTDENLVSMYTTPDNLAPLGAVGYFA